MIKTVTDSLSWDKLILRENQTSQRSQKYCSSCTLGAVVSPGQTLRERDHCEEPFDFPSSMRLHVMPTSNVKWRHFLLIREKIMTCAPSPGSGWSWPEIMIISCTTPPGPPKPLLNSNISPKTPVTKGSSPSSSKNCLVCRIILRIESFYALSRPVLLSALNAILQTTVQFPLVKDDKRRVCKSCFRRLELIKNKKKSVLEALQQEFQAKYNSTVLKNHETTANIQWSDLQKTPARSRDKKNLCHLKFQCKWTRKKLYKNRFIPQQLLQNARGHWLLPSWIRRKERKLISEVHWFSAEWKHLWKQTRHKQGRNQGEMIYIKTLCIISYILLNNYEIAYHSAFVTF